MATQLVGLWKPERMAERVCRVKVPGIPNVDVLKHETMKIRYLKEGALIIKRKPKVGDKFVTTLGRLRENGRTDLEMALFIHRCFFLAENYPPNAKVELCVTRTDGGIKFKTHFFIKEVLEPGPYAANPEKFCQHWAECGGCQFNGTRYARQLVEKRAWIAKAFPAERVFRVRPAVHGHNRFEHHVKWVQERHMALGPEGFRSEMETSPNECGRLPKRLYRAMREASETFEKNYANILEAICGRRRDGNYEVVLNVFGSSTAQQNLVRRKSGLKDFTPCLDPTDINIYRDRNPFVVGLTSRGGTHQIFGRKNTVRQYVKLEFVKKVYESGWMGGMLGVYTKEDSTPQRDILVNTEITTTWGHLAKGLEESSDTTGTGADKGENAPDSSENAASIEAASSKGEVGNEGVDVIAKEGLENADETKMAAGNAVLGNVSEALGLVGDRSTNDLTNTISTNVLNGMIEPIDASSDSMCTADVTTSGFKYGEEDALVIPSTGKKAKEKREHCNMSLPKKSQIDYSQYLVHMDLELGFWKVPGRACLSEVADIMLERFVCPMLDRIYEGEKHHSGRRITIWEMGGSWPIAHAMATVFNRLKTSKEISVVSFQHPDDVDLRRGSLEFSIRRQQKEFDAVAKKKRREDRQRLQLKRSEHQKQLYGSIKDELMALEPDTPEWQVENRIAVKLEQELERYDKKDKDHLDAYFPPLTNLCADLNQSTTLERIVVLTQQNTFDYDFSVHKSPGNVREELSSFQINKNSNPRMQGLNEVDKEEGALIPLYATDKHSREGGESLDDTLKARLKKAFHQLAKKFHPDTSNRDTEEKFQAIAKAYADLMKDGEGKEQDEQKEPDPVDPNEVPVYFVHPDWRVKKSPQYIPPPDILILTLQDCMESTLRRWIRHHLQVLEFIIVADTSLEHMKKPLYHFARLGYIVDYIQPIDTSPHRTEVMAIFKMRFLTQKRKHLDQEYWMQIEAGNDFESKLLREREKLQLLTDGDMEQNRQILLAAGEEKEKQKQKLIGEPGGVAATRLLATGGIVAGGARGGADSIEAFNAESKKIKLLESGLRRNAESTVLDADTDIDGMFMD